jgi:uncharacterized protein YydD (DUF2326 family)|tara:strand:+ start:81 stop:464 length:384 start_codon:yes stop_codon:yes gene_type:complete
MENVKLEDLVGPQDEAIKALHDKIESLESRLEHAHKCNDHKARQLDEFGDVIMNVIGDKVEAVIESHVGDAVESALQDFEIYDYQGEIVDMIDERLPEGLDDESRTEDLKAAIKEVLAGATLTMDIE